MEFKNIKIEDKNLFDDFFNRFRQEISEMTFTNLFCWRKSKQHKFCIYKEHLIISYVEDNIKKYYAPIGSNAKEILIELILEKNFLFERVPENLIKEINESNQYEDLINIEEQEMHFDYVYSIKDLISMQGGKYVQKRNQIKQFEKLDPKICSLNNETAHKFAEFQETWKNMVSFDFNYIMQSEDEALTESLKHFEVLNLKGICVHVNNELKGFGIGEKLNDNTFVEHFEKAVNNLTGAYQYTLKTFVNSIDKKFIYLNREQDLNVEGLRKAKQGWNPAFLIKKYKVSK
jgi:uncharacterized protein